jgi:SAM-dependent methyltransferase
LNHQQIICADPISSAFIRGKEKPSSPPDPPQIEIRHSLRFTPTDLWFIIPRFMAQLSSGIPTMQQLDALLTSDYYRQHASSNDAFLARHGEPMKSYRAKWEFDPYKLWSRRYEYPYVAQRLLNFADERKGTPVRLLDAGSGVTYLPYFLCQHAPDVSVVAFDYDKSYVPMFEAINAAEGHQRVQFSVGMMQNLPFEKASFDGIYCVSVLEHTSDYDVILNEFLRVLKPGGRLVLTFDLSLDNKFELSKPMAAKLLTSLTEKFALVDSIDPLKELDRMDTPADLLSTDTIKKLDPKLLPWRHPLLKAVKDLLEGHGWTGGFRSKSIYCLELRARG